MPVAYGTRRLQAASMCSQTEAWDTSRGIADLLSTSGALHKHRGCRSHEEFMIKDEQGLNLAKVVPGTLLGEGF